MKDFVSVLEFDKILSMNGYDDTLSCFIKTLNNIQPITRTPYAEMHPYLARKPLNILSAIVENLCLKTNGIVLDSFMGSGSSIFAALEQKKRAIGIDLNKISYNLVDFTTSTYDLSSFDNLIEIMLNGIFNKIDLFWKTQCNICGNIAEIEREFYSIVEDPKRPKIGKIQLDNIKYHCNYCHPGKHIYSIKKASQEDIQFLISIEEEAKQLFKEYDVSLIPNTRIAIQQNSTLSDYFSNRGMITTALIMKSYNELTNSPEKELVLLTISSMLHMLKLGDWKAGTQIPYWRPKNKFTGRNPRKFFTRSYIKIRKGQEYSQNLLCAPKHNTFDELNSSTSGSLLYEGDALTIIRSLPEESVDLIITDPPYSDQVPYIEYTAAWDAILGLNNFSKQKLNNELVVSDSPIRDKTKYKFNKELSSVIGELGRVLINGGYLAIFYHEFSTLAWKTLINSASNSGLAYLTQLNVGRQYKSIKNVLNPKSSLDGNSLVIFVKNTMLKDYPVSIDFYEIKKIIQKIGISIINKHDKKTTSQLLYDDGIMEAIIKLGAIEIITENYESLLPLFKELFDFREGYWLQK